MRGLKYNAMIPMDAELAQELSRLAKERGASFAAIARELILEGLAMRQIAQASEEAR